MLSIASFGGGVATLALIRKAVVEEHQWISESDFTRDWVLVQVAPGINLIALTILVGRRIAGARGIAVCLLGLLLPSATISILITACFRPIQHLQSVQAAVRGILPATAGVGLYTCIGMARPPLDASRRESRARLLASVILLVGSALVAALWSPPVAILLCAAGGINALFHSLLPTRNDTVEEQLAAAKSSDGKLQPVSKAADNTDIAEPQEASERIKNRDESNIAKEERN